MRTEYLTYFLELTKVKSMNKAAKNLYITQPTLRSAIATLEKEIGGSLVTTSKQGTELTELGILVAKESKIIQEYIDGWKTHANEYIEINDVFITAFGAACRVIFPNFIYSIKSKCQNINIILNRSTGKQAISQLQNNEKRIALVMAKKENEEEMQTLLGLSYTISLLFTDYYVVYLNKNHPLSTKKDILVADLLPYLYVNYSTLDLFDPKDYQNIARPFQQNMLYMDSLESIFSAIAHNEKAFSILTHLLCTNNDWINQNKIIAKKIVDIPFSVNHYLVHPATRHLNESEKLVLKYLTCYYKSF